MAHRDGNLDQAETVAEDQDGRLDLRVVVRVVGGEKGDRAAVQRTKAGGRVGHAPTDDQGDRASEERDPDTARERGAVPALVAETSPDDDVRAAGNDRLEDLRKLVRDVLPVAVDLDRDVEALVARVLKARLDGAADAEVVRKADDARAGGDGLACRPVGRAVVDDDDLEVRVGGTDLRDDRRDRGRLVIRGDDC